MIPMRNSTIFKSRWMALIWSAGIIWTALEIAGPSDDAGKANDAATNVQAERAIP